MGEVVGMRLRIVAWIVLAVGEGATAAVAQQSGDMHRAPVLVELFTSEGCSDCPPADRLLSQVDSAQPFAGVHAIVLEEHVTYWDQQGWRDPFSLDAMTDRQKEYQERFGLGDIYTPQMVVDGAEQFVGSNVQALEKAMADEAGKPKTVLTIDGVHLENGSAIFSVHGATVKGARLVAVVAADATVSHVANGENAGKTLHHVAVVRGLKEFGGEAVDGRLLKVSDGNPTGQLRIVAFLVDHKSGHVLGSAEERVSAAQ
ncbi:MAG: DUF1223 domain-containing protein [Terracidiphilus sp.]